MPLKHGFQQYTVDSGMTLKDCKRNVDGVRVHPPVRSSGVALTYQGPRVSDISDNRLNKCGVVDDPKPNARWRHLNGVYHQCVRSRGRLRTYRRARKRTFLTEPTIDITSES